MCSCTSMTTYSMQLIIENFVVWLRLAFSEVFLCMRFQSVILQRLHCLLCQVPCPSLKYQKHPQSSLALVNFMKRKVDMMKKAFSIASKQQLNKKTVSVQHIELGKFEIIIVKHCM